MTDSSEPGVQMGRWSGELGNWGRWPNDRGAMNLVTPEVVLRALGTVRKGEVIPLAREIVADEPLQPMNLYEMDMYQVKNLESVAELPTHSAKEFIKFRVHNMVNTHIDAFAHTGYNGRAFNGYPFAEVVNRTDGATRMDVTAARAIATRGVLIDVPRTRGMARLDHEDRVGPDDITPFLDEIEPGDAVIIRTGSTREGGRLSKNPDDPDYARGVWTGVRPECVDLISRRGAALLGGDNLEAFPSVVPNDSAAPIHVACLVVHGMHLVHGLDLEILSRRCAEESRRHFFFSVGALHLPRATGSPAAPMAIL